MAKKRILMLLSGYPTLSQTYKENEIKYLMPDFELLIGSITPPASPYQNHQPHVRITKAEQIVSMTKGFRPDFIHGHYLHVTDKLHFAAQHAGVPFTARLHSFDVLGRSDDYLRGYARYLNADSCAGVLCFPYLIPRLVECGVNVEKLHADWPVVDYDRFYDRRPNGNKILNTGACIKKKGLESFVELASLVKDRKFIYYPIGYQTEQFKKYNDAHGAVVDVRKQIEPFAMAPVYKRCEWLVYTASKKIPRVGWPMAIAEAQAAGAGVLIQRIRPDIEEYVGGAGFVFDTLDEAAKILSQPYPEEMRELGFQQARKSDIRKNINKLHKLWNWQRET